MAAKKPSADDQVLALIEKVKQQKAEIRRVERPNWKTNCVFSYVEGQAAGALNIHTVSDVAKLVRAATFLTQMEATFVKCAVMLGADPVPLFKWDNFSYEDWIADLALRVSEIQLAAKKSSLESLQKRLDAVISPELKRQMELDAIAAEVG